MDDIRTEIEATLKELGAAARADLADTVAFIEKKARELSAIRGDPSFPAALKAATQTVALRAASNAVIAADRLDDAAWNTGTRVMLRLLAVAAV